MIGTAQAIKGLWCAPMRASCPFGWRACLLCSMSATAADGWGRCPFLGVGFWARGNKKARHGSGKLKCDKHFHLPEKNHVPPPWTLPMERCRRQAVSPFEQADGRVLGFVEPRHDRGSVVLVDRRGLGVGADLEGEVLYPARAASRFVPRSAGQGGNQALPTRSRHLLGTVVGLGGRRLARQATRVGPGCHHGRTTLCRVGGERLVSRVCRPGGLENIEGCKSPGLGTGMANAVALFP